MNLIHGLVILTANAQTTTTTQEFQTYLVETFESSFWNAFQGWALFAIGIAVAMMIFRRIRGTARKPR